MNFMEITKMLLGQMDFFQLRRVAERYQVHYQGVRKQKLMKDIERVILAKHAKQAPLMKSAGAVSAKPDLKSMQKKDLGLPKINPISHRNTTVKSV